MPLLIRACLLLLCIPLPTFSNTSLLETKKKLRVLDKKIIELKQNLTHTKDRKHLLHQELAKTEKNMGQGVHHLYRLKTHIQQQEKSITHVNQTVTRLRQQIQQQQTLLQKHLLARYKTISPSLLFFLLQKDAVTKEQAYMLYSYIFQARKAKIDQILRLHKTLSTKQKTLQHLLSQKHQQKTLLQKQQQALEKDKYYQEAILQALEKNLQHQQQNLLEIEENKTTLTKLIQKLSVKNTSSSLLLMKKHSLRKPVESSPSFTSIGQGVTFFAEEGKPVLAALSGKVVFSDWLNGYGLLIILDHGKGFMTLYAHNQSLFSSKGNTVNTGEQIATVGHTGGIQKNGLYFEVRQHGKALPPLEWLLS
jgi:septal ring factor EnvC (AmiA/AmiB activator)